MTSDSGRETRELPVPMVEQVMNALASMPYNTPVPGSPGTCTGQLVHSLIELCKPLDRHEREP